MHTLKRLKRIFFAVFIMSLPLYFKNATGLPIPFWTFLPVAPTIVSRRVLRQPFNVFLVLFTCLACIQFLSAGIVDTNSFVTRYMAAMIFVCVLSIVAARYTSADDRYCIYGIIATLLYGLYSAPSYAFGYEQYLIPGTGGPNNLSLFNYLRCSTFGEGNYFGGYLSLMCLIYANRVSVLALLAVPVTIAFSPTSFCIFGYCCARRILKATRLNATAQLALLSLTIVSAIAAIILSLSPAVKTALSSPSTSTSERIEFFRAGISMWISNPLLGVGFGQYGFSLEGHTNAEHLLKAIYEEQKRYIANSNVAELLSELGITGLALYLLILFKLYQIRHPLFSKYEVVILFIVIGVAMPTLFQIVVAASVGILLAKYSPNPARH